MTNSLLTAYDRERLCANGEQQRRHYAQAADTSIDFMPVVKLFTPDAACTWLLTELDPSDLDLAFGLCDLGLGYPELGYVRLSELLAVRGHLGLPIERDLYFTPTKTLTAYAEQARVDRRILT